MSFHKFYFVRSTSEKCANHLTVHFQQLMGLNTLTSSIRELYQYVVPFPCSGGTMTCVDRLIGNRHVKTIDIDRHKVMCCSAKTQPSSRNNWYWLLLSIHHCGFTESRGLLVTFTKILVY